MRLSETRLWNPLLQMFGGRTAGSELACAALGRFEKKQGISLAAVVMAASFEEILCKARAAVRSLEFVITPTRKTRPWLLLVSRGPGHQA
jgi:hypothetical protein